ncbi:hypothetical protein ACH4UM_05275 [Streptomyces sp. NPDC020801]|uniref:hypothetical protein n=1 Tax=unclassified Streptomyces TaxID=2593676 RepID=UPI0037BB8122
MGDHAGGGKLIASAFADWQQGRGKASMNGLVTAYDKNAEILSSQFNHLGPEFAPSGPK